MPLSSGQRLIKATNQGSEQAFALLEEKISEQPECRIISITSVKNGANYTFVAVIELL
jgi:hypothetical protein